MDKPVGREVLQDFVKEVDERVRAILQTPAWSRHYVFAVQVGIQGWARVSAIDPDAATKAEELFRLVAPTDETSTLQQQSKKIGNEFLRHRRILYNALLLTWSRSTRIDAPERANYWLDQMIAEEQVYNEEPSKGATDHGKRRKRRYCLVDTDSFNRVMAAYAAVGNVKAVDELWSKMTTGPWKLPSNAVTYDCWIKAVQVQGKDPDAAKKKFLDQLYRYRQIHKQRDREGNLTAKIRFRLGLIRPLTLTLSRVVSMFRNDPQQARMMIDLALDFEKEFTECHGLVDVRVFTLLMQDLVSQDDIEEAEKLLVHLLELYEEGKDELRPTRVIFGMVMDGYAKRQNPESLAKLEALLSWVEEHELQIGDASKAELDCTSYNILMNAYLRTYPDEAVPYIHKIMDRMKKLAKQHQNKSLFPDRVSYGILMTALKKEGKSDYPVLVEDTMQYMVEESRTTNRENLKPDTVIYSMVLDAWAKSGRPDAVEQVKRVFEMIKEPDTQCYNTLLYVIAKYQSGEEALGTLKQMMWKYTKGINRNCAPCSVSYSTVIRALCNSGQWEAALSLFDGMLYQFDKGYKECYPDEKSVCSLLHGLRYCNVSAKHEAALEVLTRLNERNLPQGPQVALAFITACGEAKGDPDQLLEAASFISLVLKQAGRNVSPAYDTALKACSRLLDFDDIKRDRILSSVFELCVKNGLVTFSILETLRSNASADTFLRLTCLDAKLPSDLEAIPLEWRAHVQGPNA